MAADAPSQSQLRSAIHDVLHCMALVEREVVKFRDYLSVQSSDSKPLNKWSAYTEYASLDNAIQDLNKAAGTLHDVSKHLKLEWPFSGRSLNRARQLSTSVSNIAVFAMGVMNEKTGPFVEEVENSESPPAEKENVKHVITSELSKLLKHCTEATNTVWSALDLLEKVLVTDNPAPKPEPLEPKLNWRGWLTLLLMLLCFGRMLHQEYVQPTALAQHHRHPRNYTIEYAPPVFIDVVYKHLDKVNAMLIQGAEQMQKDHEAFVGEILRLASLYSNLHRAQEGANQRIDNLWDSLGEPNERGTYDVQNRCDTKEVEQEFAKLREEWAQQAKKMEWNAVALKKEMQKWDLKMMNKLNKIERKSS